jgi:DNA-binding CsgD family transcriptional regulator
MKSAVYGYWSKAGLVPEGEVVMLSPKPMLCLELLTQGLTNTQIAQKMGISEQTVKNYVSELMKDTDCDNRTQVAVKVITGQIRIGESPFKHRKHNLQELGKILDEANIR